MLKAEVNPLPKAKKTQFRREKIAINGWLNIDKPYEMTSTQAVSAVKRLLSPKKIGHAGTLDPLATGILPLALGEATKTIPFAMDAAKAYRFTVKFGEQTTTDDVEGEVIATSDVNPSRAEIEALLPEFIGEIQQTPPAFSAIKVDGKRAYDLARAGKEVELKSRIVRVDGLQWIEQADEQSVTFEVQCGKGTYVRSLARDLAKRAGSVGHVTMLRRLSVGNWTEKNTISLEMLEKLVHSADPHGDVAGFLNEKQVILPPDTALGDILAVRVNEELTQKLRHGLSVLAVQVGELDESFSSWSSETSQEGKPFLLRAVGRQGLVALLEKRGHKLFPVRVFHD